MESVVGRAEGSAKSPLNKGVSSSRDVTTLRCTPLAVDGFPLRGPSVAACPGGSTIWPARAFGSIGVFRGPVDGGPAADGHAQTTVHNATTTTDSPSTERRIRLILDSMRPNDMRTPGDGDRSGAPRSKADDLGVIGGEPLVECRPHETSVCSREQSAVAHRSPGGARQSERPHHDMPTVTSDNGPGQRGQIGRRRPGDLDDFARPLCDGCLDEELCGAAGGDRLRAHGGHRGEGAEPLRPVSGREIRGTGWLERWWPGSARPAPSVPEPAWPRNSRTRGSDRCRLSTV